MTIVVVILDSLKDIHQFKLYFTIKSLPLIKGCEIFVKNFQIPQIITPFVVLD